MNKKDYNGVDRLDNNIIENTSSKRTTGTRFKKRALVICVTVAILICLFLGIFVILATDNSSAPIYKGITVSAEYPSEISASPEMLQSLSNDLFCGLLVPFEYTAHQAVMKKLGEAHMSDGSAAEDTDFDICYIEAGGDIYVTVYLQNPKELKIRSLVLNGKEYTNDSFEERSTPERIIIKQNVGDTVGTVEYKIESIKYFNGIIWRNVPIDNDDSASICVHNQKLEPTSEIKELSVGMNDISFTCTVSDPNKLISLSDGKLYAMLYGNGEITNTVELTVGKANNVSFSGLNSGKYYGYVIVGVYDAYDKQGSVSHIMIAEEFSTPHAVFFKDVTASTESISFSLDWNTEYKEQASSKLLLYRGEEKIRDIELEATIVEGLLSNRNYTLVVEYIDSGAVERREYSVKTLSKYAPVVTLTETEISTTSIGFDLAVSDPDGIFSLDKIELLCEGQEPIPLDQSSPRQFNGLTPNTEYIVRVAYSYDINNGNGVFNTAVSLTVRTLPAPSSTETVVE